MALAFNKECQCLLPVVSVKAEGTDKNIEPDLDNFLNKSVEIKTIGTDRYGRTIAVIYHNNKNINLSIVRKGYGWVYTRYLPKKPDLRKKYTSAESIARTKKLGLWGEKKIIAPWEWRRKNF